MREAADHQEDEQADQLDARVDALHQPVAARDVLTEHHLLEQPGPALQGLGQVAALLALADAPAGAHRDLLLQEPGRDGRGGLRVGAHDRIGAVSAPVASSEPDRPPSTRTSTSPSRYTTTPTTTIPTSAETM